MSEKRFTEEQIATVKEWDEKTGVLGDRNEILQEMVRLGLADLRNNFLSANVSAWNIRRSLYEGRKWTPEEYTAVVNFMDEPDGTSRKAELGDALVRLGLGRRSPSGEPRITGYGREIEAKEQQTRR
jgi:hypothetical protein